MNVFYLQVVEAVPVLPEIPLPAIQPNYRPLPSIDFTPLSPQRRKGETLFLEFETSPFNTHLKKKQTFLPYCGNTHIQINKCRALREGCAQFFARRTIDKWGLLIFKSPLFFCSVPVCNEEEDAGFTGKRLNSKMVVFSGSKTSYLPKMMTLYEQCIRVLQNNIDCEQHSFGFTEDVPVGGARVPPTGSAPQHSQEVKNANIEDTV